MPTNTAPQSVSRRYAYNLLARGANRTYELEELAQQIARTPKGLPCGFYYSAIIKRVVGFEASTGEGSTPIEAVTDALRVSGVTFR